MRSRPGRGQSFKAKSLRPKPIFWPRVYFAIEDLTSLGRSTHGHVPPHHCYRLVLHMCLITANNAKKSLSQIDVVY